ncbi:MAG: GAF domain-containing protein [Methylotenera sp.]|nr:GAF domain-containing protein [Oligoflexia bacterium]
MESIQVSPSLGKKEAYEALLPQIFALLEGESDLIANLANIAAALKQGMGFFWVGFYLVKTPLFAKSKSPTPSQGELVLGPFQGPVACTRIPHGKGVCGQAWAQEKVLIVPDVDQFPGHIACSSASKSEIVLPFYLQPDFEGETRKVMGVLDADSDRLAAFDAIDELYLTRILARLCK